MQNEKEEIKNIIEKWTELVDSKIQEILTFSVNKKFHELTNYQIKAGGKRLRPAFLFIACRLLGGNIKDATYPAAGVEILHNYTLIVDDIIDNSEIRRKKPTVWKKYGKDITECIGVIYSASILESAQKSKNPGPISEIFAQTMKVLIEGEIMDILFERFGREEEPFVLKNRYKTISKKDYLLMVRNKTAFLFGACCQIGGICAKGSKKDVETLKKYGTEVGIAFQIRDDILDIFGNEEKFGKEIGKDIKEGKGGNIVNIYALEELKPKDKKEFADILKKEEITEKDVKRSIELIKKTKAKEKSQKMAEYYIKKAKEELKLLPQNKWNKKLHLLADFIIKREK